LLISTTHFPNSLLLSYKTSIDSRSKNSLLWEMLLLAILISFLPTAILESELLRAIGLGFWRWRRNRQWI